MDKLISVVIPTHNRQWSTDRAVESVHHSDPAQIEIIVVDDCGTQPYRLGSSLNGSGIEVRLISTAENGGPGVARKAGVSAALGRFIAFLDSDDCYDRHWLDTATGIVNRAERDGFSRIFVSGMARGSATITALIRSALGIIPGAVQIIAVRMVVIFLNPFVTPSIVLAKELCRFHPTLRHCEDYFSNAFAVFGAQKVVIAPIPSAILGRSPHTPGGLSAATAAMSVGEKAVRREMWRSEDIPRQYKLLIPFGFAYQWIRMTTKTILPYLYRAGQDNR